LNGRQRVIVKGLHGKVAFEVQRLIERETGARTTYFEITGQFQQGYRTPGLEELAAYYSNRMSYEEVEALVARFGGEQLLSDQRIEQLVIDKAVAVSQRWAQALEEAKPAPPLNVNPTVDVYAAEGVEVRMLEDGIGVKAQKDRRVRAKAQDAATAQSAAAKRVSTDVLMLERRDGGYQYFCAGMDQHGQTLISLEEQVRSVLQSEYRELEGALNVVSISDGARARRKSLQTICGTLPTVMLDWYPLHKKTAELLSMIALNKADKDRHLQVLSQQLWAGQVEPALAYLRTAVAVRNPDKHAELIGYLDKHRHEIIDYGRRQATGKPIGSGRMEKGVDQVIGHRQKKKGMAWSAKGSKALAILKVVELNDQWQQLWFPDPQKLKAAA
jgi:hypothetical protein